jgi:hypothetical protein
MPHRQGRLLRTAVSTVLSIAGFCGCNPGDFDALVRDRAGAGSAEKGDAEVPPQAEGGIDAAAGAGGAGGVEAGARDGGSDAMVGADAMTGMDASSDAAADAGDSGTTPDGGGDAGCAVADSPDGVGVTTTELGILDAPDFAPTRNPVGSAAIGNRLAFLFDLPGDASMAAWTTKDELLSDRRFDEAPSLQLLWPAGAASPGPEVGLTGVIARDDRELLIFFSTFSILTPNAIGVATLRRNDQEAMIVHPVDQFLPVPPHDNGGMVPWHPVFSVAPVIETTNAGSFLYLYACAANPAEPDETIPGPFAPPCRVARAPLKMATDGSSWRYWDGNDWNVDPLRAVPVIRGGGVSSITYNRYLGAFLGMRSDLSNNVVLIWAPRPEGPWQTLRDFPTLPGPGMRELDVSLFATEHPALRDACQQDIFLTYSRDILLSDGVTRQNETRLMKVSFE